MSEKTYEIEQLMNELAKDIADEYDLDYEDCYGDCYPNEIHTIQIKMELSADKEELQDLMDEARKIFEGCAEGYIEFKKRESEEMDI